MDVLCLFTWPQRLSIFGIYANDVVYIYIYIYCFISIAVPYILDFYFKSIRRIENVALQFDCV
jgi:hypothetical protein